MCIVYAYKTFYQVEQINSCAFYNKGDITEEQSLNPT